MRWAWGAARRPTERAALKHALDTAVVVFAVVAAYLVRFERIPDAAFVVQMAVLVFALPLMRLGVARVAGTHRASWRQFGLPEAIALARAVAIVSAVLVAMRLLAPLVAPHHTAIPLSVIALEGFFTVTAMLAARVLVRLVFEAVDRAPELEAAGATSRPRRALLVGAGRAGRLAARELALGPDAGFTAVGFLDDDPSRLGLEVERLPVLGATGDAAQIARMRGAEALILTMPSASNGQVRAVVERLGGAGLPIHTIPSLRQLFRDRDELTSIRPLQLEDLLGRDVFAFDDLANARVRGGLGGRRVLVTGAGGSIGSELCRQLAALDVEQLILVDACENNLFDIDAELRPILGDRVACCLVDIRSAREVAEAFERHRPHVVFHAAAFKHVPMMELHPSRAVHNNVAGTRIVIEAARRVGVRRMVYVSTDKAVDPTSVMGATKRAAELLVLAEDDHGGSPECIVVRFGNVLGSKGSVVHTFARQIAAGGPVTVTGPDVTRYFMTTAEAVRLVLQAAVVGRAGDTYLLDMGEPVRIVDLARHMIRLAGPKAKGVEIAFTGMRPGEKVHESLASSRETTTPSGTPGLLLVRGDHPAAAVIEPWAAELERRVALRDDHGLLTLLARHTGYVPSPQVATEAADACAVTTTAAG
jgi:FlaA1/EpsC-like NDP-sugar epimerase